VSDLASHSSATTRALCPTDLELARFVEGTLAAGQRAVVMTHLADCDDCREVVATVVAAAPGRTDVENEDEAAPPAPAPWWLRRPRQSAAALAVAAMVVVALRLGPSGAPARPTAPEDVWTAVAAAVGPARAIEARLSGMTAHVPLAPPTRASAAEVDFGAQALAARLGDAATAAAATTDRDVRRAARHAAGVAALVAGRASESITLLEAALADAPAGVPARADILADLSAAHAETAETSSRDRWELALGAADDALTECATHTAARFNRALALERLARTDDALRAWRALAADGTLGAGWRDEAAGHVRVLAH
jgi:hypothetical protein